MIVRLGVGLKQTETMTESLIKTIRKDVKTIIAN